MYRKSILIAISLVLLVTVATYADFSFSKVGTSGMKFLQIGVDARSTALGGAVSAIGNDAAAIYWNPAGIVNIKNNNVLIGYTKWFSDINYSYLAYTLNMGLNGTFGIQFGMLGMGEMNETTIEHPEGTGRTFSSNDMVVGATYAKNFTDKFSFGITGKFVRETIWDMSASTFGVDLGVMYQTGVDNLRIGGVMRNFGGQAQFTGRQLDHQITYTDPATGLTIPDLNITTKTTPFSLPTEFRIGMAYDWVHTDANIFTTSFEFSHPNDGEEHVYVGLEDVISNIFAIRVGYKYRHNEFMNRPDLTWQGQATGLSAGAGFHIDMNQMKLDVDYSIANYDRLGFVHRVTLGIGF
ncbi:hypothetical protein DRP44_05525 [candidate division TA06 bacterium]|uniref:Type IX secretion system protein PorV domain-containing protein n=1 Tax=candidate division TA06 bacterium TaxID=2250710 RepID=A0A660S708_UNCT6|nr:MAG: hypothetical protein DRP44_05525 [candidate division TA06 bacterium]